MSDAQATDLFRDDPIAQPLTYPGRIPTTSGILTEDAYVPLLPVAGRPANEWIANLSGNPTLSQLLVQLDCQPMSKRFPVVAVGSNASPSQMRRKFLSREVRTVVPMTLASITGIAPGISAHVSKPGYIPAAPIEVNEERSRLFVLWLDEEEFEVLDATEPNYWRRCVSGNEYVATLESGVSVPSYFIYVGKHGCLIDANGNPKRLTDQTTLIATLLGESAALKELCGDTPDEFLRRVRSVDVREAVRQLFFDEGRVQTQSGLLALPRE